jgi:hypothetical protein
MQACQTNYKFQTVSLEQLKCLGVSSALNGYGMGPPSPPDDLRFDGYASPLGPKLLRS